MLRKRNFKTLFQAITDLKSKKGNLSNGNVFRSLSSLKLHGQTYYPVPTRKKKLSCYDIFKEKSLFIPNAYNDTLEFSLDSRFEKVLFLKQEA